FFAIWWAWMDFTWFASAYDTDDVPYRFIVFIEMTGALIFAAGVPALLEQGDISIAVGGYVIMRIAEVMQWWRASHDDPEHRPSTIRHGIGIALCQIGWVGLVFVPKEFTVPGFFILALLELLAPVWAERVTPTTYHAHHIIERYGLFTIIVLGESVLSAIVAIQIVIEEGGFNTGLIPLIVGGLLTLYSMWWLYFYQSGRELFNTLAHLFVWAYGHSFLFGAIAAFGAGLAIAVDREIHHAEISPLVSEFAVTIPAAVFLVTLWILHVRPHIRETFDQVLYPVVAVLVLLTALTEQPVLLTGILFALLLGIKLIKNPPLVERED
ncbi:MAG: low temperature requirement protein A, partial [Chloroflexi bacterium]|nr:low temperature requirement protein A [Chloroflexota bacterium]